MSFNKALVWSIFLHPAAVAVFLVISIILMLFGINLFQYKPPKVKMDDIEFVLVDREATPINKNTRFRSEVNSRAGGKHDPTRKVSMPSPTPAKTQKAKASSSASSNVKKQSKSLFSPKSQQKSSASTKQSQQTTAKSSAAPRPAAPSYKPSTTLSAPKPTENPKTAFNVPMPPSATKGALATGPVGSSGTSKTSVGGGYSPKPSLAPTYKGSGSGSGSGSKGTSSSTSGTGNYGNPGPGNPNGRPGIDAIAEPDFGPYMRELQRRIKMNWDPPKGNESKRVVLLFKIARDGRLLSCSVSKSSGLASADNAAMQAVKLTAPFKPLPANFKGSSVDIQFTFDYNVFGGSYR